jgi:hypothetical protein
MVIFDKLINAYMGVMNFYKISLIHIIALLFYTLTQAQFYTQGEDPASLRWEKIHTENFKIIYPKGFYEEANRFVNLLENVRPEVSKSLNHLSSRIPVVIHTRSVVSNGFVSWAPRRMEFSPMPGQDNHAQDWFEQLALHEYRHAVQVDKFNQGTTRGLSIVFGEMATGAMLALMPSWFLEGDAVVSETALSSTGRGRLPSFEMEMRTISLDSTKSYSYDQVFLGSYRYFVPDHYQYGYHMVSYIRLKYGSDFWDKCINFSARNPYLLAPMSIYASRTIGLNRDQIYLNTLDTVRCLWNSKLRINNYSDYSIIASNTSRYYRQYKLPQPINDNCVVALKTGIDMLDQFIKIDSLGNERKLIMPGPTTELNLSAASNILVWDEIHRHPRWSNQSYSIIKAYDMSKGKLKQITRRSRYFSPDISPAGSKIATIETDNDMKNFIVILDGVNGKAIKRFPSPGNKVLQYPEWINELELILITFDGYSKSIEKLNTETSAWLTILNAGTMDVAEPLYWKGDYLYRASYNGIENIFAIKGNGKLYQVTDAAFGAFHPALSIDSLNLIYSNYTSNGFELVKLMLDTSKWIPIDAKPKDHSLWADQLAIQEMNISNLDTTNPYQVYNASSYSKVENLFRFHSWIPFYIDIDENNLSFNYQSVKPGFVLFSQNLLNTAYSTLSYRFDKGYHILAPSFTYRGLFPVINLNAEIGGQVNVLPYPDDIEMPINNFTRKKFVLKSYVPLTYIIGKYYNYIQPQVEYEWSNTLYYNDLIKSGLNFLHYKFYFFHYLRMTMGDIYPSWGQRISLSYTHTPGIDKQFGKLWSAEAELFFPGVFKHHSIRINTGYQKQQPQNFLLPINRITFPRGYESSIAHEMFRLSSNYTFPVIYPEFSLSWIIYIKRLSANFFYDTSYGEKIWQIKEGERKFYTGMYNSMGLELFMDIHLFRFLFPFKIGIRNSYLPVWNEFDFELLFSIDTSIF